jgi:hypothetical protein
MIGKSAIATAAMLLLSFGSGLALAQNGPRGNCPNPNPNCPRKGQCARNGGAKRGAGPMQSGRGMANCPRR